MNPPIWYSQGTLRCQDPAANGKTQLAYAIPRQPRSVIVVCPDTFTSYQSLLGTPDKTDFSGSGKVLDDFRTVSGTLFHELLHILFPNSKPGAFLWSHPFFAKLLTEVSLFQCWAINLGV